MDTGSLHSFVGFAVSPFPGDIAQSGMGLLLIVGGWASPAQLCSVRTLRVLEYYSFDS